MSQIVAIATPSDVFHIDLGLKQPPLRYISTNLAENKGDDEYEEINEDYVNENYDRPNSTPLNKYDYLGFAYYNGTKEQSS